MDANDVELLNELTRAVAAEQPASGPLRRLLRATGSRAVALWRLAGRELQLLGFEAVDDMPAEVRDGFAAATARLSLAQVQLGCVQAALTRQPTVATCREAHSGLVQSAGWISRFGAVQSLAIPILRHGDVSGVLAISTPYLFGVEDPAWQLVQRLSDGLADSLTA